MTKASALTIGREALLPALASVTKVIEKRNTIPVMQNVLLRIRDGRLTLTGSDLDAEISATVDCEAVADLELTLPAGTLLDAVRKLPESVTISLTADSNFATIAAARSRFRLPVLPASDYPSMSAGELGHSFTLAAGTIASMIATVSFAISSEETRYYLNGIHWHATEDTGHLNAVATDGHRLAKFPIPLPEGAAGMPPIIIPRKTITLLKGLIGDKGEVSVSLSQSKIRFEYGGVSLISKLIDGTYPDYSRVVPPEHPNRFTVDKKLLSNAVDRVTTISIERGSAVKFLFGADNTVGLSSINPDAGSAEDAIALESMEGAAVEVGFNGRYCLDVANACPAEKLTFYLNNPGDPARIVPVSDNDDPSPLFVLMPMRV